MGRKVINDRTIGEVTRQLEGRPVQGKRNLSRIAIGVLIALILIVGLLIWGGTQDSTMIIPWFNN
jgi:hypothetical protein